MPSEAAFVSHPVALMALVLAVVAGARLLEQRLAWVQAISSAVVCTLLGIVFANAGVIPQASPIYDGVNAYAVPYAIVLVILGSDLRDTRPRRPAHGCGLRAGHGRQFRRQPRGDATPSGPWSAPTPGSSRDSSPRRSPAAA